MFYASMTFWAISKINMDNDTKTKKGDWKH